MRPAPVEITERRPAIVPDSHPDQRCFSETRRSGIRCPNSGYDIEVGVYRNVADDTAELSLAVCSMFEAKVHLSPSQLRRLASDLLDAAADIEAHPAVECTREGQPLIFVTSTGHANFIAEDAQDRRFWVVPA